MQTDPEQWNIIFIHDLTHAALDEFTAIRVTDTVLFTTRHNPHNVTHTQSHTHNVTHHTISHDVPFCQIAPEPAPVMQVGQTPDQGAAVQQPTSHPPIPTRLSFLACRPRLTTSSAGLYHRACLRRSGPLIHAQAPSAERIESSTCAATAEKVCTQMPRASQT